jgi:hypothetical protein
MGRRVNSVGSMKNGPHRLRCRIGQGTRAMREGKGAIVIVMSRGGEGTGMTEERTGQGETTIESESEAVVPGEIETETSVGGGTSGIVIAIGTGTETGDEIDIYKHYT